MKAILHILHKLVFKKYPVILCKHKTPRDSLKCCRNSLIQWSFEKSHAHTISCWSQKTFQFLLMQINWHDSKKIFQSRGWPMNMFSQNISEKFVFILMSMQESFLQGQSRVHSGHAWGSSCDLSCTDTTAKFIGMLACSKKVEVYQWTCFPCISQKSSYSL